MIAPTVNVLLAGALSGLLLLADIRPPVQTATGTGIHFQWSNDSWEVGFIYRFDDRIQKTLTFSRQGSTNKTWLSLDGRRLEFKASDAAAGGKTGGGQTVGGKAVGGNVGGKAGGGEGGEPSQRSWRYGALRVSQRVEKIVGEPPSREKPGGAIKPDTAVVFYEIHNSEFVSRRVGLETTIDTMIAGNDQNPFAAPGTLGMITTFAEFTKSDVPTFLWAMEGLEPRRPGFRAVITLKVGGDAAPPDRVLVRSADDAKVTLTWQPRFVAAGESVRFAYGIGRGIATEAALRSAKH